MLKVENMSRGGDSCKVATSPHDGDTVLRRICERRLNHAAVWTLGRKRCFALFQPPQDQHLASGRTQSRGLQGRSGLKMPPVMEEPSWLVGVWSAESSSLKCRLLHELDLYQSQPAAHQE